MPLSETILLVMALLGLAMLVAALCRNLPVPFTVFLVVVGVALGHLGRHYPPLQALGTLHLTPELVLFLFLPALIFESALNLNARQLVKDLAPVTALAIPALLASTAIISGGLWLLLDMDPLLALLFGALISATDPVAVIALFKELGAPLRLNTLVEGESLFNDATAIVLFKILLGLALAGSLSWADLGTAGGEFLRVFIGGAAVGAVLGYVLSELALRLLPIRGALLVMTLVMAYATFILAEHYLHVSGVMAVVAAALTFGLAGVTRIPQTSTAQVRETWEFLALCCNALLFLLVGLSVDLGDLAGRMGHILVAALLVLLARASAVYTLVPATTRMFRLPTISLGERHIMWWGGLKGGLAIAIVLSIPQELPGRDLLVDMTLGVVLVSLLLNAPTIRPLMRWLGMDRLTPDERSELRRGLVQAVSRAESTLDELVAAEAISRKTRHRVMAQIHTLAQAEEGPAQEGQALRRAHLEALRAEAVTLEELRETGLVQQYTYLELRATLQRDRESLFDAEENEAASARNPFLGLEAAVLRRLREANWATGLLARYQSLRLAQRLQHDMAGALMCRAALVRLADSRTLDPQAREAVSAVYSRRLRRRQARIEAVRREFPEFYERFEARVVHGTALQSALVRVEHQHHEGEIGTKAYGRIERLLHRALERLPPVSAPLPRLSPAELIRVVPLFRSLPADAAEKLAARARFVTFLPGDTVIGEGERGDALYVITRGRMQVTRREAEGPQALAELGEGDFFGETALLGDQVRTATVQATTPATVLRLGRKDVLALAAEDPVLDGQLQAAYAARQGAGR